MGYRFDAEKVAKLLSEVREALSVLQELAELETEELAADRHRVGSAKYNLILAIEGCLDLANHVISRNDLRVPEDYGDTFRVLAAEGILDRAFADRLVEMAKFRNRLVHVYWDVDLATLHGFLQNELGDVERFLDKLTGALGP